MRFLVCQKTISLQIAVCLDQKRRFAHNSAPDSIIQLTPRATETPNTSSLAVYVRGLRTSVRAKDPKKCFRHR
jgi:hypothetical protein